MVVIHEFPSNPALRSTMIQLTVVTSSKFNGSINMVKITASRIAKIVLGTAHGNRQVTDAQMIVSTAEAKAPTRKYLSAHPATTR